MYTFRFHVSLVLLTCFLRVLVPDAWLLALHSHEHTTHEQEYHKQQGKKTLLSSKHQHCYVDHFYNVPFQAAAEVTVVAIRVVYAFPKAALRQSVWESAATSPHYLRGPPARA